MGSLQHGAYCAEAPDNVEQLRYAGGGHGACGGYLEILRIGGDGGGKFIAHEYRTDVSGRGYRWREFADEATAVAYFDRRWCSGFRDGFTNWNEQPYWEACEPKS